MRSKFKWIFTLLIALSMQFSFAQEKTVSGVVSDANSPIPGANVVVKGTKRGTQTDVDGKYSIKAKQGETLVYSYIGLADTERPVGASNTISLTLKPSATVLDDVLITGALGIKRTKDAVVSAQKVIGSKELTQASNPNAILALTGKVSGLQISTVANGVNADTRIVLRGNRSITGNNQALIVIDNAISSATVLSQLPPDVIESVNIVKGAQGAALYGEQGVNGVIIVTTKKGTANEKFTFGINSSIDFETVNFVPQTQREYGQGWSNGYAFGFPNPSDPRNGNIQFSPYENGSWGPSFSDPAWANTQVPVGLPQANGQIQTSNWAPIKDNIKKFFKTGTLLQNGFNFNVGGKDSYAFVAVNRQTTDFVVQDDKLARTSFLFKAGKKIGKFSVDGNVNYITESSSETNSDLFSDLVQTASNIPVENFGELNQHHWTVYATSPKWTIKNERFDNATNLVNGILNLGYEFNKHISVNYNANVQVRNTEFQNHKNEFKDEVNTVLNFDPYTDNGLTTETYSDLLGGGGAGVLTSHYFSNQSATRNIYGDLLLNFNYDITKELNFKANIGNNIQDRYFRETSQGGDNLDVQGFYNISNVLNIYSPTALRANGYNNRYVRSRRVAGFVNLDFAFNNYLFLNATARLEKSSVVKNAYFYPSVGVSFIPTKAFDGLKDNKIINYIKLNASYTSVGNTSAVSPYGTNELTRIPQGFPFGGIAALQYDFAPTDPNIKPEFVNTFELGGQLGFFKDRITLEGSVYNAKTKDLITRKTNSTASGATSLLANVGDLENKGFEIDLGIVPIKTKNFKWDMRMSYSTYKTRVIKLADGAPIVNVYQPNTQVGIFAEEGEDFPLIKGSTFVRDANGNIVVDANGTPAINSAFSKLGKAAPDYILGFTNSFEYKGFKLTTVADFRTGGSFWSETKNLLYFTGGDLDTAGFDRTQGYVIPGSVTSTGAVNTVPAANNASVAGTLNYFTGVQRRVGETSIVDATALKIREISISYALSDKLLKDTGIKSFRFGINARNPFVFLADGKFIKPKNGLANNSYSDPEASNAGSVTPGVLAPNSNAQGISNIGQYPTTKTIGFTINVTF